MTIDKKLWRNRKERKELARRLRSEYPGLEVVHPHAAGVDVGNGAHYAAVRPDRDSQPVRPATRQVSVSLIARRQPSFELRRASEFFFDFARVNRK
jgi:hypothetical protein